MLTGPAGTATASKPAPAESATDDARPAHLVLRNQWPIALCGEIVRDHLGTAAPGRDRCAQCLKIAVDLGLGRPGWGAS